MKVIIIPVVIDTFVTLTKRSFKRFEELEIGG